MLIYMPKKQPEADSWMLRQLGNRLSMHSVANPAPNMKGRVRPAEAADISELLRIDQQCFPYDAMSKRSFRRFLQHHDADFVVIEALSAEANHADFAKQSTNASATHSATHAESKRPIVGYAILLFRQATKLCRLYSFAVAPELQGQGYGKQLMHYCIEKGQAAHCLFLRTETKADNEQGRAFFDSFGFAHMGLRDDYYDDGSAALVLQKQLHFFDSAKVPKLVPHLTQTTPFTCGPASLLMALAWFDRPMAKLELAELEIWREATTIYMTSGHGGCGPHGLARAALRRGLKVAVWVNQAGPVLLDSVRNEAKREIMSRVQEVDIAALKAAKIPILQREYTLTMLGKDLNAGKLVIALISMYQFDRSKAPHWVLITAIDDEYVYINDPDDDLLPWQTITERQYLPIPRATFDKAFVYGSSRLRAAVVLSK